MDMNTDIANKYRSLKKCSPIQIEKTCPSMREGNAGHRTRTNANKHADSEPEREEGKSLHVCKCVLPGGRSFAQTVQRPFSSLSSPPCEPGMQTVIT